MIYTGFTTADSIGERTGGGVVTKNEYEALKVISNRGPTYPNPAWLKEDNVSVWMPDEKALQWWQRYETDLPKLVHFYSGTFTETVKWLRSKGVIVTYTCAAHDKEVSKEEHLKLEYPFPYLHLTDPKLWDRYSQCYKDADVLICPSQKAAEICTRYGRKGPIEIIPHGCYLPDDVKSMKRGPFRVGYLGAVGPDKGLIYLLQAWKHLDYRDGSMLVLGGRDSISSYVHKLLYDHGGGAVCLAGWFENISDFYNDIHLYIQPASTEGFGIEVLEAMVHARIAIASDMAGAADVTIEHPFVSRNSLKLADRIDQLKQEFVKDWEDYECKGRVNRKKAQDYSWDKVREQYANLWRRLLS